MVFRTTKVVLFIDVFSFQGVLIRRSPELVYSQNISNASEYESESKELTVSVWMSPLMFSPACWTAVEVSLLKTETNSARSLLVTFRAATD